MAADWKVRAPAPHAQFSKRAPLPGGKAGINGGIRNTPPKTRATPRPFGWLKDKARFDRVAFNVLYSSPLVFRISDIVIAKAMGETPLGSPWREGEQS